MKPSYVKRTAVQRWWLSESSRARTRGHSDRAADPLDPLSTGGESKNG